MPYDALYLINQIRTRGANTSGLRHADNPHFQIWVFEHRMESTVTRPRILQKCINIGKKTSLLWKIWLFFHVHWDIAVAALRSYISNQFIILPFGVRLILEKIRMNISTYQILKLLWLMDFTSRIQEYGK